MNDLAAFFSYRLRCRGLSFPKPKWNPADLVTKLNEAWITTNGHENRQQEEVYTIDPLGCTDFDDAFSITPCSNNKTKVSIYIANVASWLMQSDSFEWIQRVSTIYLPTGNMPMLPPILSETHCSLKSVNMKLVLAMDCIFNDLDNKEDPEIKFGLTVVRIRENLVYESPRCLSCSAYKALYELTRRLDPSVTDSHDVIEYWMVRMNRECGKKMAEKRTGIFRVCPTGDFSEFCNHDSLAHLPVHIRARLAVFRRNNSLNSSSNAKYSLYCKSSEDNSATLLHGAMNIANYVHITSPIRRLADLLNQLLFMRDCMDIELTEPAISFLNRWTANLETINRQMQQTRKYQMECELMHACRDLFLFENESRELAGCVFGIESNHASNSCEYMVYIEELKMFSRVKEVIIEMNKLIENYTYHKFRVYMFEDESKLYRKIRVQRLHNDCNC